MIGELLHAIGLPGSIVAVVSTGVALWHAHSLLGALSRVKTWLQIAGVVVFLAVVAASGVVPGVRLSIDPGTVWSLLTEVASRVPIPSIGEIV